MSADRKEQPNVSPIYRIGNEITFPYEGNIRATVEGFEVIDGVLWLSAVTNVSFQLPVGRVVHFEPCQKGESDDAP
jgi:hypothetical protein